MNRGSLAVYPHAAWLCFRQSDSFYLQANTPATFMVSQAFGGLLQQSASLLKNVTCNNLPGLEKIWLVPEPVQETKPLYSCKIQPHYAIEVDFMDIVEQTPPSLKSKTGSVNVCIGVYRNPFLAELNQEVPTFFLNGVRGEIQGPSKCLQVMEPSPFRAVGLPGGLQGSGKYYYEVEMCSTVEIWWGIMGWATESFTRFEEGHFMGFALNIDEWTEDPEEIELPFYDSSQSITWWDDTDVFWAEPDVYGLAVDIDKATATVTKNGVDLVSEQPLALMGKRIFPILHVTHRARSQAEIMFLHIFLHIFLCLCLRFEIQALASLSILSSLMQNLDADVEE